MKIQAKKKFGQNFISDTHLINKIVNVLNQNAEQLIIEIGPGTGALTQELVKRFKKVLAIEIDHDMESILQKNINASNLQIIIDDFLNLDLKQLIKDNIDNCSQVAIISNLPYYITSQILFKILNVSSLIHQAVFMMQKEVGLRVCANANDKNYNNLSVACQFFATRIYEFTVKKQMFNPIPKIDSAIISLTFNNQYSQQVDNSQQFLNFVRTIFNNRRKTILNNLTNITNNKDQAKQILQNAQIPATLRPENLNIEQYINLFNNLNSQ